MGRWRNTRDLGSIPHAVNRRCAPPRQAPFVFHQAACPKTPDAGVELNSQQFLGITQGFFGFGVFACFVEGFAIGSQRFDFAHVGG